MHRLETMSMILARPSLSNDEIYESVTCGPYLAVITIGNNTAGSIHVSNSEIWR